MAADALILPRRLHWALMVPRDALATGRVEADRVEAVRRSRTLNRKKNPQKNKTKKSSSRTMERG